LSNYDDGLTVLSMASTPFNLMFWMMLC